MPSIRPCCLRQSLFSFDAYPLSARTGVPFGSPALTMRGRQFLYVASIGGGGDYISHDPVGVGQDILLVAVLMPFPLLVSSRSSAISMVRGPFGVKGVSTTLASTSAPCLMDTWYFLSC